MDFEMQYQISRRLDCTIRGGMCMPFHTGGRHANRLSIDIDLLTRSSIDEVGRAMDAIGRSVGEI